MWLNLHEFQAFRLDAGTIGQRCPQIVSTLSTSHHTFARPRDRISLIAAVQCLPISKSGLSDA